MFTGKPLLQCLLLASWFSLELAEPCWVRGRKESAGGSWPLTFSSEERQDPDGSPVSADQPIAGAWPAVGGVPTQTLVSSPPLTFWAFQVSLRAHITPGPANDLTHVLSGPVKVILAFCPARLPVAQPQPPGRCHWHGSVADHATRSSRVSPAHPGTRLISRPLGSSCLVWELPGF